MEPIYRQTVTIPNTAADCFGRLKSAWLLAYVQEVSGIHCELLGVGNPECDGRKLFWVISRQRVQITRLPMAKETITLETWPCPTTRVAYPRATVAYDSEGCELFRVMSLWVLMDAESRTMVLPGKSGIAVDGIATGRELAAPGSLVPVAGSGSAVRTVGFTDLDTNGHMNNTKYLDWVADLLPGCFHKTHPVKEFIICYMNEALEGQKVHLSWVNDQALRVDAHWEDPENPEKSHKVFTAKVIYE